MSSSMALQLRPKTRPIANPPSFIHLFSSSSDPNSTNPTTAATPSDSPPPFSQQSSQSSFSSYFSDVKARLKQQQSPPRKPSFSSQNPFISTPSSPSKIASLEEIRKNLSEFRRRTAAPSPTISDPTPSSSQPLSFQELYKRNVMEKPNSSPAAEPTRGGAGGSGGIPPFKAIRESLRQLRTTAAATASKTVTNMDRNKADPMSISAFKESLKLRPAEPNAAWSTVVIGGGSETLPTSVFGKEMRERKGGGGSLSSALAMKTEFVKMYDIKELGEKLRMLRPKKAARKEDNWFSLEELNDRLMKLREIEEKEIESTKLAGVTFKDLRESLENLKMSEAEKAKKSSMQRLDLLSHLGGTPNFMLAPPKEHLVEKYFHPDNMSSAEKLKIELKTVRDEFKMSESDCGSARVQVAQLTTKIKHLSTVLHKKDKHSRKGLIAMVQRRKKLLKYLRRTDWDSFCLVLSRLGLRDNPDYKH